MYKCWIALSNLRINHTIQRISIRELNYTLLLIEIYPLDSVIQLLNNLSRDVRGHRQTILYLGIG